MRVSGRVEREREGPAVVDLALEASGLPMDETLAEALPADMRARYRRFQPQGSIDLTGRLFREAGQKRLDYELTASAADAALHWEMAP